jgi:hypothetical protein
MNRIIYLVPGAVLGVLVSFFLQSIARGFLYLVWRLRHKRPVEGKWYSYHYTKKSHQPRVRQMRWGMKQNLRGYYTATCWGDGIGSTSLRPPVSQRGTASPERGYLVISVYSRVTDRHSMCVIRQPGAFTEISGGLWLGRDLDGRLIAGPIIFTRVELSLKDAESLLKSSTSARSEFKILGSVE